MKKILFLFILLNIILLLNCQLGQSAKLGQNVKLGQNADENIGQKIEQKLQEDDINNYEEDHSIDDLMKKSIKEYIEEEKWSQEQELDKDTFKKMFVYLIQKGALKKSSSLALKKLADNILEKHPGPILVKNLKQYFNIEELTLTYTKLLNPGKITDL